MKIPILFDMDDTAFDTHTFMLCYLMGWGICPGSDTYITPENGGEPFVEMLREGRFMLEANRRPFFTAVVDKLVNKGHSVGICTHRGYHDQGERFTRKSLEDHLSLFDRIHCLDSSIHPDKLEYLDNIYGPNGYILIDDNPVAAVRNKFTRVGDRLTLPNNVMLFTKGWNKHIDHPYRIDSFQNTPFFKCLNRMLAVMDTVS